MSPIDVPSPIADRELLTREPLPITPKASLHTTRQRGLRALFACLLCLGMGQSLFFAVLPPVARELGLSETETSVIFSLSALLWIFCSPFWGRQSDKWGRKPIIIVGIAGFATSTLLVAIMLFAALEQYLPAIMIMPALILARGLFGAFGSGSMPAAQAYLADRTFRRDRAPAIASLTAAFGIGNIVGPGFAATLIGFGFLTPFFAISILAFIGITVLAFLLPERMRPRRQRRRMERVRMREIGNGFLWLIFMGLMASFAYSVIVQLSAFHFMDRLGLESAAATESVGIALMMMAMSALFAQMVLIQRFRPSIPTLFHGGAICMGGAFLGLAFATSYAGLTCALALSGLGFGLMRPGIMATASLLAPPDKQGAAAGFINATAAFGHVINPFTGMILYQRIPEGPFLICALLMGIFIAVALLEPHIRGVRAEIPPEDAPADPPASLKAESL